jgi:hypothetical protein
MLKNISSSSIIILLLFMTTESNSFVLTEKSHLSNDVISSIDISHDEFNINFDEDFHHYNENLLASDIKLYANHNNHYLSFTTYLPRYTAPRSPPEN